MDKSINAQPKTNKVKVSLAVDPNQIQMKPNVAKNVDDMKRNAGNSIPEKFIGQGFF